MSTAFTVEIVVRPSQTRASSRTVPWVPVGLGVAALVWFAGMRAVDQRAMSAIGLLRACPVAVVAGLGLTAALLAVELTRPVVRPRATAACVVALIAGLYATAALGEAVPRVPTAYLHAGFVDHIARHGTTLPGFDARFSWPGFFAWSALLLHAGGTRSQIELIRWAPLVLSLAYLVPLLAIARGITPIARWQWAGLTLFLLANWVGQDYYAPQGVNFLLYLCVIALVLRLRSTSRAARRERADARAVLLMALAMAGAAVVSHQLTPVILVLALGALAVFGYARSWRLAVVTGVLTVAYLSFAAVAYWVGHMDVLFGGVGRVSQTASANVASRVTGSAGHLFVVRARMALVAFMAVAALLAFARRRLPVRSRRILALLAIVPFGILPVQSYGGEGLLRSYFFALPFACLLIASLLPRTTVGRATRVGTVTVLVALVPVAILTRFGNDKFEATTTAERAGLDFAMDHAPRGSTLLSLSEHMPWMYKDVADHRWVMLDAGPTAAAADLAARVSAEPGAWVVLTRSQDAYGEVSQGRPAGWLWQVADSLHQSGLYRTAFENEDAMVLVDLRTPHATGTEFVASVSGGRP